MSNDELLDAAARHFVDNVPDDELLRQELRGRPPRLEPLLGARRTWYNEAAELDMQMMNQTFLASTVGGSSIATNASNAIVSGSILGGQIMNWGTTLNTNTNVVRQSTASEMVEQMQAAQRVMDEMERTNPHLEEMRRVVAEQLYRATPYLRTREEIQALTESATARPEISADRQARPQPEWHWNGPAPRRPPTAQNP